MTLKNILNSPLPDWEALMASLGQPAFRARQLQDWVFRRPATDFSQMTNLSAALRQKLQDSFNLESLTPIKEAASRDGNARKVLFRLQDGKSIESVLLSYDDRLSVCVSTQVGCAVGCPFCATGQQGFERNLSVAEIADQVLYFARRLSKGQSLTNAVFMGMGEPLANYDATLGAVGVLNSERGFGLGARHMTISTAGLAPQIVRLGKEPLQVGLAVSLHAAEDSLRNELVPINQRYPLKELISACKQYMAAGGRRITFEYTLSDGVNDSLVQARQLAHLLKGLGALVNVVPANPGGSPKFKAPSPEKVAAFMAELERLAVRATLRASRGADIAAACGQLRSIPTRRDGKREMALMLRRQVSAR